MALMIMVSGWMENDEDYKRAFGVLPEIMSFHERLIRFYQIHAPERIEKAAEEIEDYELHQDQLYDEVMCFLLTTFCISSETDSVACS